MTNRIIINADDYGLDENRTKAILEGFRIGAITRTTAIVTMPYCDKAVELIRDVGLLGRMGLHLNLTEGVPLTAEMRDCRLFCDALGCFTADFHRNREQRLFLPRTTEDVVRNEMRAQIEKFLGYNSPCRHIDSHHHVHTDYSVARILKPLLREYGFKSIRKSRNIGLGMSFPKRLYKLMFNWYMTHGLDSTKWFGSFEDYEHCLGMVCAGDSLEVMVHPMYGSHGRLDLSAPLTDNGRSFAEEMGFLLKNGLEVGCD